MSNYRTAITPQRQAMRLGTASYPGIHFSDATDTGFFYDGAGSLGTAVCGEEVARFSSAGLKTDTLIVKMLQFPCGSLCIVQDELVWQPNQGPQRSLSTVTEASDIARVSLIETDFDLKLRAGTSSAILNSTGFGVERIFTAVGNASKPAVSIGDHVGLYADCDELVISAPGALTSEPSIELLRVAGQCGKLTAAGLVQHDRVVRFDHDLHFAPSAIDFKLGEPVAYRDGQLTRCTVDELNSKSADPLPLDQRTLSFVGDRRALQASDRLIPYSSTLYTRKTAANLDILHQTDASSTVSIARVSDNYAVVYHELQSKLLIFYAGTVGLMYVVVDYSVSPAVQHAPQRVGPIASDGRVMAEIFPGGSVAVVAGTKVLAGYLSEATIMFGQDLKNWDVMRYESIARINSDLYTAFENYDGDIEVQRVSVRGHNLIGRSSFVVPGPAQYDPVLLRVNAECRVCIGSKIYDALGGQIDCVRPVAVSLDSLEYIGEDGLQYHIAAHDNRMHFLGVIEHLSSTSITVATHVSRQHKGQGLAYLHDGQISTKPSGYRIGRFTSDGLLLR